SRSQFSNPAKRGFWLNSRALSNGRRRAHCCVKPRHLNSALTCAARPDWFTQTESVQYRHDDHLVRQCAMPLLVWREAIDDQGYCMQIHSLYRNDVITIAFSQVFY